MQSARVSLALLPLLRKQVIVDRVKVDGLRATLKRTKDGKTNIDDLLGPSQPKDESAAQPSEAAQFDIGGVSITDAAITLDDELNARHLELTRAEISSGRIAPGTPGDVSFKGHVKANQPLLDADVNLQGELLLDPPHKRYAFKKLSAEVDGRVATLSALKAKLAGNADLALEPLALDASDIDLTAQGKLEQGELQAKVSLPQLKFGDKNIAAKKIDAQLTLKQGARTLQAQLALPSFEGSAQAFKIAAIGGEFSLNDGPMQAKAKLSGALEGDMSKLQFASPLWTLALDGRKGDTAIKGTLSTPWTANFKSQAIDLTRVAADVQLPNPKGGALALKASGVVNARLDKHNVTALLSGKLDQSAFSAKVGMSSFSPAAYSFDVGIDQIDADRYRASTAAPAGKGGAAAAEAPIDLSALKDLNASGSLRVGALQFAGIKTSNVKLDVRAAGGKLDIAPLTANLYQGSVAGSLSVVASKPPRFAVKQTLSGVSVGPLLKDLAGSDRLEGRGNVVLDVSTQGASLGHREGLERQRAHGAARRRGARHQRGAGDPQGQGGARRRHGSAGGRRFAGREDRLQRADRELSHRQRRGAQRRPAGQVAAAARDGQWRRRHRREPPELPGEGHRRRHAAGPGRPRAAGLARADDSGALVGPVRQDRLQHRLRRTGAGDGQAEGRREAEEQGPGLGRQAQRTIRSIDSSGSSKTSSPSRNSIDDVNQVVRWGSRSCSSIGAAITACGGALEPAKPPTWNRPLGSPPLLKRITIEPPDFRVLPLSSDDPPARAAGHPPSCSTPAAAVGDPMHRSVRLCAHCPRAAPDPR